MSVATSTPPVLIARELCKTYRDGEHTTEVLRSIDLELAVGSFTGLVGRSGSGKSTLLSILGTLLRPSAGTVEVAGARVDSMRERPLMRFRNRTLGFVFQFHHLMPDFTALENVLMPAYVLHRHERAADRRRAERLLDRVGLSARARYRATRLSGGQKQRVAVARALMNEPRLVLADEPTGNLDREASEQLVDLLHEISAEEATAFLVSTHDPEVAARCDRIVHVEDGRVRDGVM
ncbi:MAG: ABC transporter ATP-binding protein [Planctomycetota bacterium]